MDPFEFTVSILKQVARELGITAYGTKLEIIKRLQEGDPTNEWITLAAKFQSEQPLSNNGGDDDDDDLINLRSTEAARLNLQKSSHEKQTTAPPPKNTQSALQSQDLRNKEIELLKRERDIFAKELELARREIEILRNTPTSTERIQPVRSENVNTIKDMLEDFDGEDSSLGKWKEQFRIVCQAYNLDDSQARLLMSLKLKGKAKTWLHSKSHFINISVAALLAEMTTMFDNRQSRLDLRKKFEGRTWKTSESFSNYFHNKLILANAVPIEEEEITDYIIDGIPDVFLRNQARIQCFSEKENLLRAFEKINLDNSIRVSTEIKKNTSRGPEKNENSVIGTNKQTKMPSSTRCFNCSRFGHISSECKQPKRQHGACFKCFQMGHQSKDCPEKNMWRQGQVTNVSESPVEHQEKQINFVSGNVQLQSSRDTKEDSLEKQCFKNCVCEFDVRGEYCELSLCTLLDTGSPISFLKESCVPMASMKPCKQQDRKYSGINNSELVKLGIVKINVTLDTVKRELDMFVVPNDTMCSQVVLGRDALKKFNLGLKALSPLEAEAIEQILNIDVCVEDHVNSLKINSEIDLKTQNTLRKLFFDEYENIECPECPKINMKLNLQLTNDRPIYFGPRRLSFIEKEQLQKILDDLISRNIIRASDSPYASPIVMVKKKSGEHRLCVDFRFLNKITLRDNYPLPLIEDQIDKLRNKRYFTLLDLRDGFHHIDIEPESVKYTSFITPLGQFEYLKMPFGLKTAPAKFQRFVNTVLEELLRSGDVVVYLDDILITSETIEKHLDILKKVFRLLVDNKLELRLDKCSFLQTEIEYLGYKVSAEGVSPTNHGISAVTNFPIPQNVRDVQCFLGLCAYFRKFVGGFSIIAAPLYELLKKGVEFTFDERALNAFEILKNKLIEAPVLSIYDPRDETELHCDASKLGYGAVLLQRKKDKQFHPIFYFSKRSSEVESKYHSFELETLAIIYALRRFRIYLQGIKFKIVTDCNALTLTLDKKEVNPRISRWALELENFDKTFEHRSGEKMKHVDAFSRAVNVMIIEDNTLESNLAICQNLDLKIRELREKLQTSDDKLYEMRNGLIYRKSDGEILFYVPEKMENQIMKKYHDEMGHFGAEKTCEKILRNYWFPEIKDKVKIYIANCLKCIAFSPSTGRREGFLHPIPKGDIPFLTCHVDHFGPIDKRLTSKQHILLVVDGFTKFVKLYPVKTTDTKEAVNCLREYFKYYSRPKTIVSDRGSCFTSSEFKAFLDENNVKHVLVATATPRANGQVERVNRVMGPMLAKISDPLSGKHWYKMLADVEFALNNTSSSSTGTTGSMLLFGVSQRGKVIDEVAENLERAQHGNEIRDLKKIRTKASEKIIKSQNYNKAYFDKKRKQPHAYEEGDYVMIKNFDNSVGAPKKLIPPYKGPYEIVKKMRNDRYVLKDVENFQVTQKPYIGTWEVSNMKPWCNENVTLKSTKNS